LTCKEVHELLDYNAETGDLVWRRSKGSARGGFTAGFHCLNDPYIIIGIKNRNYLAHRLAWLHFWGQWPKGPLDHEDGDPSNNSIFNLVESSKSHNARNMKLRSDNVSGVVGVCWDKSKDKWRVKINVDGRTRYDSHFIVFDEAVVKRKKLERQYDFNPNHGRIKVRGKWNP